MPIRIIISPTPPPGWRHYCAEGGTLLAYSLDPVDNTRTHVGTLFKGQVDDVEAAFGWLLTGGRESTIELSLTEGEHWLVLKNFPGVTGWALADYDTRSGVEVCFCRGALAKLFREVPRLLYTTLISSTPC